MTRAQLLESISRIVEMLDTDRLRILYELLLSMAR